MKQLQIALFIMFILSLWIPPLASAEYSVSPESLVMGIGDKVQIESLGADTFTGSTTVTMDGEIFNVNLISSKIIEIDIPARRHWYGPKRLTINNGGSPIIVDGKFKIDEFRPFGTKIIMFDFEGGNISGNSLYHDFKTANGTVENELTHGSAFSLKETIKSTSGSGGATRWWITRSTSDFPGRGVYIAEATGMNRFTYDVKAPGGFNGEIDIGTYHSDPDLFPNGNFTDPESYNWHFYLFHYLNNPNNTWRTHQEPLFYSAQRQSGGCCSGVNLLGEGSTEPTGHRRGEITEDSAVVWKRGGKTFTVGSFDVLTRLYIDHTDRGNTGFNGVPIWFDNIGFTSVDDFVELTPSWSIRDANINTMLEFPFSFTNRKNDSRNFYVVSQSFSSFSKSKVGFSTPEGVYEDVNKNGLYDSGEPRLNGTPTNTLKLDTPLSAGETRHFVLRMQSSSTTGDFKTGLINFFEADVSNADAVYSISTRYSSQESINKKGDGAYRTFTFHVNTPSSLPSNAISTPQNVTVKNVGNDVWIVWDEVAETSNGTLAWYEIQRGESPSTFKHYRTISAASPGYIDLNVSGEKVYRVRSVSTRGTYSPWILGFSDTVQHNPPTNLTSEGD